MARSLEQQQQKHPKGCSLVTVIYDKGDILFQLKMNVSLIKDYGITGHVGVSV